MPLDALVLANQLLPLSHPRSCTPSILSSSRGFLSPVIHLLAYNLNKGTVISFTPHFFLLIRYRMVLRSSRPFIYHSSDKFSYRVCNRRFLFAPRYSSILKKTHCFSNTLAVFSKYCFKIMTHLYHYPAPPPAISFTKQISLLLVVSMLSKGRTKLGNLRNVHGLK